jgi:hypothetical protein
MIALNLHEAHGQIVVVTMKDQPLMRNHQYSQPCGKSADHTSQQWNCDPLSQGLQMPTSEGQSHI